MGTAIPQPHIHGGVPAPARRSERGAALLEAAFAIPLLLIIAVGIFEFGRAYQFKQVLTNAAREGARYAVTPNSKTDTAKRLVSQYMMNGGIEGCTSASACEGYVTVQNEMVGTVSVSTVTVSYPFNFIVLQPITKLVSRGAGISNSLTMSATATMRNEG
jgi:Flp pilus assembly protein TadG